MVRIFLDEKISLLESLSNYVSLYSILSLDSVDATGTHAYEDTQSVF